MKYTDKNGHVIKAGDIVYFEPLKCHCCISEAKMGELVVKGRVYHFLLNEERASHMEIKSDADREISPGRDSRPMPSPAVPGDF